MVRVINQAAVYALSWRRLERCLSKHVANHQCLLAQLARKLSKLNEVEKKCDFHKSNHKNLSLHLLSLQGVHARFAFSSPRLIPYPVQECADSSFVIAVWQCEKCLLAFHFSDTVIASCLHCYHPWCALLHFREIDTCVKPRCTVTVSPKWCKSFGFRTFGTEMTDLEESLGCEDVQIQNLANQRNHALLHCPNVGKCMSCLTPYRCNLRACPTSILSILQFCYLTLHLFFQFCNFGSKTWCAHCYTRSMLVSHTQLRGTSGMSGA